MIRAGFELQKRRKKSRMEKIWINIVNYFHPYNFKKFLTFEAKIIAISVVLTVCRGNNETIIFIK